MSQLAARKGVISRFSNSIRDFVHQHAQFSLPYVFPSETADLQPFVLKEKSEIINAQIKLNELSHSLEIAVDKFCVTCDQMEVGDEHDAAVKAIVDGAQDVLMNAADLSREFKCRLQSLVDQQEAIDKAAQSQSAQQGQPVQGQQAQQPQQLTVTVEHPDNYLPRTPIPHFNGRITEWENFWELFNDNVHQRSISNLQKFNYLLEALRGDARACIGRFQVTSDNYERAIQLLKKKYEDKEVISVHLHTRLDNLTARSHSTKDQRSLLDQLLVVSAQLVKLGENLDGTWMLNRILSKFSESVQRATLKKKGRMQAADVWDHETLMEYLEDVISTEERIDNVMNRERSPDRNRKDVRSTTKQSTRSHFKTFSRKPCLYCQSTEHLSYHCTVKKTPKERSQFLQMNKLCGNCGSSNHAFKDCTAGGCKNCGGKHHGSTCYKEGYSTANSAHNMTGTSPAKGPTYSKPGGKEASQSNHHHKSGSNFAKDKDKKSARQNFAAEQVHNDSDLEEESQAEDNILHLHKEPTLKGNVIILTGAAKVIDPVSKELHTVQILLDTGSELSFIATSLAEKMRLPIVHERMLNLHTFGSPVSKEKVCSVTTLDILDSQGGRHTLQLLKNDYITSKLPPANLTKKDWEFIKKKNIELSMPEKSSRTTIKPQILLGCDQMWNLMNSEQPQYQLPSGLQLVPSKLGYIITGRQQDNTPSMHRVNKVHTSTGHADTEERDSFCVNMVHTSPEDTKKEQWDRYWTLDSSGVNEFVGPEHIEKKALNDKILENFNSSIEKREDGYYVRLPWKEDNIQLPDNRAIALRRLQGFLRSYKDRRDILQQYDATFKDQLSKGILEEVDETQHTEGGHIHYIPHQPVITPLKETTKLRVVFDASAHFKGCPSLNEVLHQGPVILPEMVGMLMRFRIGSYAIISDVEKAFLQVRLQEIDRDATRCLWVRDLDQPVNPSNIVVFRFTRVTFGINSSPFLLAATILHHLAHYEDDEIVKEIKRNLYVDNLFLSAQTLEKAKEKCTSAKQIFDNLNMNLREFMANDEEITKHMEEKDRSSNTSPKVLGIKWDSTTDCLVLHGHFPEKQKITKRTVTQQIASLYDPLGWMVPLVLPAKLFLQNLWRDDIGWDVQLSKEREMEWTTISEDIQRFNKEIPRCIGISNEFYTIVTFTDASDSAMAACTYLVNSTSSHLVIAKSKLPSVKEKPTIPKMEMNGVTMGMRLSQYAYKELHDVVRIKKIIIMSDSQITLSWLKSTPDKKTTGVLVSNRIKEIRRIVKDLEQSHITTSLGYVSTHENPADHGTRGLLSDQFVDHYWWSGPDFLQLPEKDWPDSTNLFQLSEDTEGELPGNVNVATTAETQQPVFDLARYGNFKKAQRIGAYILRFVNKISNALTPDRQKGLWEAIPELSRSQHTGFVKAEEMRAAHDLIIRDHQKAHITSALLRSWKELNIRRDESRILRCYGRLGSSTLADTAKYPYIIAPRTALSHHIITELHNHLHVGIAHTISEVRQKYWIPSLRQQVRTVIANCVPCQRFNNLPYKYPEMEDLPSLRVQQSHPFEHIGLDYFGPLSIATEAEEDGKAYGCILTCMTTRLLHLELVKDVSTPSFLNALRRFFARRGVPRSITSDNAPTIILGEEILRDTVKRIENSEDIAHSMATHAIDWKHITPYSPWQGGFYERLIKTVKQALYKSIGKRTLNFDDLATILSEIEASINTRPLTYQEERWEDQPTLRPIDFIQKDIKVTVPLEYVNAAAEEEEYLPPEEELRLRTRRQVEEAVRSSHRTTEKFWKIWQEQYLTSLLETHKRTINDKRGSSKTPAEGAVVLIMDDNLPRHQWRMGRISKLCENAHGVVREVELIMPNKRKMRRPVNLIVPLELDAEHEPVPDVKDTPEEATEVQRKDDNKPTEARYNLRTRNKVDYREHHVNHVRFHPTTWITITTLLALLSTTMAQSHVMTTVNNTTASLTCTSGGFILNAHASMLVVICAEDACIRRQDPEKKGTIQVSS